MILGGRDERAVKLRAACGMESRNIRIGFVGVSEELCVKRRRSGAAASREGRDR